MAALTSPPSAVRSCVWGHGEVGEGLLGGLPLAPGGVGPRGQAGGVVVESDGPQGRGDLLRSDEG